MFIPIFKTFEEFKDFFLHEYCFSGENRFHGFFINDVQLAHVWRQFVRHEPNVQSFICSSLDFFEGFLCGAYGVNELEVASSQTSRGERE